MSEDYKYGLSKEEYDKAMADMHNAYKIRDENGNILSEEAFYARGKRGNFPVKPPAAEGPDDALIVVEQFANGKQPEGFHYEPGRLVSGCIYDGVALGRIEYNNPLYNLELAKYQEFLAIKPYLDEQEKKIREAHCKMNLQ